MNRLRRGAAALLAALACTSVAHGETMEVAPFGEVTLYRPPGEPRSMAIFLSGDGGWNAGVVDMARLLASRGALVAGVGFPAYLKALDGGGKSCAYPAADLERLAHVVQAQAGIAHYLKPVLVGHSSGATAAYGALAQSPRGTFAGGLGLGFCPDIQARRHWCEGSGPGMRPRADGKGYDFLPASSVEGPFIALLGEIDQVCEAAETRQFMAKVGNGRLVMLPHVGHGYSVPRNWQPQFLSAYDQLAQASSPPAPRDAAVADLPLIEIAASGSASPWLAVMLSGDGGWAGLDRDVAGALAASGVPVVGWDSLRYFWNPKNTETMAHDLDRVIEHYSRAWNRTRVLLIGYSQGADTAPFMATGLSPGNRGRVGQLALIGPSTHATFEFHVSNWLGKARPGPPTLAEVRRLSGLRITCIHGADEEDSLCHELTPAEARVVELPGGHHFGGNYARIASEILADLR